MDNWFRFQYRIVSEMWGHMGDGRAGNEKTGPSVRAAEQANPFSKART